MKFISAKCPNCGGHLKVEEGTTKTVCEYCNEDIIIDDESIKINVSGKVSVDGVKTDKDLINSANELLDMGEYIKAKKLFDQFSTNNPDQYQGWLGLLICRTRNFTIRDNNILFENDIDKYYKFFQRTAPQDIKDEYFETMDRYMYPDKWKEIDRQKELKRQEEERQKREEERRQKYAAAEEENRKNKEAKMKEKEQLRKNNNTSSNDNIVLSILCYIHVGWSILVAFASLISLNLISWLLFNISALIFIPAIRKIMTTKYKIPYWAIIIIRIAIVILSYVVLGLTVPRAYENTWKSSDGMTVEITKNKVKITENSKTSEYKYISELTNSDEYILTLENSEKNYKFRYYEKDNKVDFCLLNSDGSVCEKYLIPENPSSTYRYRTSEDNNLSEGKEKTKETKANKTDTYMEALRKCTVMEAFDILTTGGKSDNAFDDAKKTCESWYKQWGEKDFFEAVNEDWKNKQNEQLNGKPLTEYLNTLGW